MATKAPKPLSGNDLYKYVKKHGGDQPLDLLIGAGQNAEIRKLQIIKSLVMDVTDPEKSFEVPQNKFYRLPTAEKSKKQIAQIFGK